MAFSIIRELCNHHNNLNLEPLHHPKKKTLYPLAITPHLAPPAQGSHLLVTSKKFLNLLKHKSLIFISNLLIFYFSFSISFESSFLCYSHMHYIFYGSIFFYTGLYLIYNFLIYVTKWQTIFLRKNLLTERELYGNSTACL